MPGRSMLLTALGLLTLLGCSSGSSNGTGGGTADGGDGGGGGGDSGAALSINGCNGFVDDTAPTAAHKIDWNLTVATSPTRCMTIAKGQTVAFEGDLAMHPLGPAGGDSPSPFAAVPDTGKVTFSVAGTFGFVCGIHASMTGAIKVVD